MKKIVIIGGGAAGLMAAYSAAIHSEKNECSITVIEKNERMGRKIMITGKGRCNVTNNCDVPTLIANTPRNGKFLYSSFSNFASTDTIDFFKKNGVPLKTERGNRVFPVSDKAVDIVDALVRVVKKAGVGIINGTVKEIVLKEDKISAVKLEDDRVIEADSVIVATGGISYPLTGSTGDGYRIAQNTGHTVTETVGSLVPLECHEGFCSRLSGLSLKNVTFSLYETGKKKAAYSEMGEMLFTHFGISGPLVLSASAHMLSNKNYIAEIDLKPALTIEQLDKRILRDFEDELNRDFSNALDKLLPKSLIPVIVALSGIPGHTKVNQISREQRLKLIEVIKHFTLHITRRRPVEEAIITRGGVSVKCINPATMQSRTVSGLYFAGEVIDVDAYTGGFNLQIAFSTGYTAGKSVVGKDDI